MEEYVLGTSDHELTRLRQQHEVWLDVTNRVLDDLALAGGERVVDLGCGPGFVLELLRERVGAAGEVVGVDESARWVAHVGERVAELGWTNVRAERCRIQDLALEPGSVDLFFLRWVLGFLPQRAAVLRSLVPLLKPGGRVCVMDYNHYGVSLFPECESFWRTVRATRRLYETRGGNTWVMGEIHRLYREAGLEPRSLDPFVIAGPSDSDAFRWADSFFPYHTRGMVEAGLLTESERAEFLADWRRHAEDPDAVFYSPIVAAAVGRRPS